MSETKKMKIKVVPNTARTRISSKRPRKDIDLCVELKAKPEHGAANRELVRFLAKYFRVSVSDIKIIRGQKASVKQIMIKS